MKKEKKAKRTRTPRGTATLRKAESALRKLAGLEKDLDRYTKRAQSLRVQVAKIRGEIEDACKAAEENADG